MTSDAVSGSTADPEAPEPAPSAVRGPGRGPRLPNGRPASEVLLLPVLLIALGVALTVLNPVFLSGRNLGQILLQASILGIAAVGVTIVIVAGDLDLSIGSNVALSGVVAGFGMTQFSGSVVVGVVLGLLAGLALGVVNGLLAAVLDVAAFVVTLGTGVVATGLALYITNGLTVAGLPMEFQALANTEILGLRSLVWFMVLMFVIGYVILHRTTFGTRVFATGGNREAAFLSGISVKWVRFTAFVFAGLCGGLAGVLMTSRVLAGQPDSGTSLTLFATAAVILGGTRIVGGEGSMIRTVFGVLLIAVVQNGLDILGVDYALQQVAVGVVFVLAACLEVMRRRR